MNNAVVDDYKVYCSALESIASRRKIYASESVLKCGSKKNSKTVDSAEPVTRNRKEKNKRIPFISSSSATKSHHMGVNIQTTRSMIQLFPAMNSGEPNVSMRSSHKCLLDPQAASNRKTSSSDTSVHSNNCPARFEEKTAAVQEDGFDDVFGVDKPNPWTVRQTDEVIECAGDYKNICYCPNLSMDGYDQVMAPYVKRWRDKQKIPFEIAPNPYTKARTLRNYELLSRRMQELQQTVTTMKTELGKLFEKYTKLYEQHVRNQNGVLIPVLLETEDKINELKAKVGQTIELYNEAATVDTRESDSSANLMAAIEADDDPKPKETAATTLTKMLRRIQLLQAKLKTGHYHQCSVGDHAE